VCPKQRKEKKPQAAVCTARVEGIPASDLHYDALVAAVDHGFRYWREYFARFLGFASGI